MKASACSHKTTGTLTWVTHPPSKPRHRMSTRAQNGGVCLYTHKHRTLTLMPHPPSEPRCRMSACAQNGGVCLFTHKHRTLTLMSLPSSETRCRMSTIVLLHNEGSCLYTNKSTHSHLGDTPSLRASLPYKYYCIVAPWRHLLVHTQEHAHSTG